MTKKKKFPRESFVSMTELVLPNDTNTLNNLMGGRLMHWMDIVSAIAGQKHSNSTVVTASVDNISFRSPIRLGNVVTLKAKVTRAFSSSMEIRIDVDAEDVPTGHKFESNSAYRFKSDNRKFINNTTWFYWDYYNWRLCNKYR